ncbi:MAG TPA: septum formation inhibitor Maf [Pricia antarctica]|uniref:Septum formation inhibitor Maf n=1 Tax=Pricia antarctica TaxID=641691 RepID=A0A831QRR5_9FLAO|nr:septum formation inhibitor Maf [Pricia antarctica]
MNSPIRLKGVFIITMVLSLGLTSCNEKESIDTEKEVSKNQKAESVMAKKELSETFKSYWYAGDAEITSYQLQQARYGETRDGKAVLIYVTEPFLPEAQVKADESHPDNVPVLKLNTTKNYLTGIYPYSIMTSSFYPVHDNQHAIKLSFSAQEWCGQVYAQLNNREQFDVMSHSYFESEGDQNLQLEKTILENEIWNKIRIDPASLPVGEFDVIPSLEYIRLAHIKLKAYKANLRLSDVKGISTYEITYPELERSVKINFAIDFPHAIEGWSETAKSGFGANVKSLTSTATKMKTYKTPYWRQNGNKDLALRDSLGL